MSGADRNADTNTARAAHAASPAAVPAAGAQRGGAANFRWLLLTLAVILLDQWTKRLIAGHLSLLEVRRVLPVFDLVYYHNPGAAFSFLIDASGWQRWLFTALAVVVSLALLVWLQRIDRRTPWVAAAVALVLGGAVGNAVDRVRLGYVIDFIQVHWGSHYFPAFNVADSGITVGAAILILDAWLCSRRARNSSPQGV
jgi:signal peptidase II